MGYHSIPSRQAKTTKLNVVEDAVLYLPRKTIHPDPDQPRVHPDAELQASIDTQGIIQAITVRPHPEIENHWVVIDGERRWLGAAHLATIPCRIRLDLEDPAERLITQLTANTGKPLTAIEQARAFKKILEDGKLSQAALAEQLGIPRSTIGDRIRLVELHAVWMKLIESGKLQVSHAPLIHQYRAVPDEYQVKAAKNVSDGEGWQMQKYPGKGDIIPIAAFRKVLHEAFKDYVVRLDEVRSYKGPVLEIEEETWSSGGTRLKKVKYAADIKLWRPIKREAEKRAKKARESSGSPSSYQSYESPLKKALKAIKAAGYDLPVRNSKAKTDETVIMSDQRWASGIHPRTLLEKLDPTKLLLVNGQYGSTELATTDAAAVDAARKAYKDHVAEVVEKELAPLRAKLTLADLQDYAVSGPGVAYLLAGYIPTRDAKVVALALGLPVPDEDDPELTPADAERLLSGLAAATALRLKVPNDWTIEQKVTQSVGNPAFKVEKNKAAKPPKSKKPKQKPIAKMTVPDFAESRAKMRVVDAGPLDTDLTEVEVEEEELVEA